MDSSHKRRISVSTFWATSRVAVLDTYEKYEDSYAITQEFREWITSAGEHPEFLDSSYLKVPDFSKRTQENDADEMLEI